MLDKIKSILSSGPKTALIILALIVVWMLLGTLFGEKEQHTNAVKVDEQKGMNEVLVEQSQAQAINREISILGQTAYSRRVLVTALTNGTVTDIPSTEGKLISKSKTIVQLDDRAIRAQFNHADALEKQKKMEYTGSKNLFDDELISAARLADSLSQYESAKAQKIQKQIQLESTRVTAPFEGVLQKVMVEQGDYVRTGQELAEILDFSPFIVSGEVSEKEAVYIEQGLKADARLIDGSIYHGVIAYKSSQADQNSRSFKLELEISNKENQSILSGISSSITIPVTHNKAHRIATSSLEIDDTGKFGVKIINADNLVSFHNIEVVKSSSQGLWVTGLPDTANIIVRGQGFVNAGDIVVPVFQDKTNEQDIPSQVKKPSEEITGLKK
jgi:multidrug efflux system membrane fusion protein